jgi:hypothetical protein
MQYLKKYAMLIIKALVKIVPDSILSWVKKNPKWTALYSNALHRSGLFYGRPSKSALAKLYKKNILEQENKIQEIGARYEDRSLTLVVLIVNNDSGSIQALCKNLQVMQHGFSRIIFWCGDDHVKSVQSLASDIIFLIPKLEVISDLKSHLSFESCFLIHEWDRLHVATADILKNCLNSKPDIAYVDRDYLDENDLRHNPEFFPDWNPDLQLSTGYVSSGVLVANGEWLTGTHPLILSKLGIGNWITDNYLLKRYQRIVHLPLILLHSCQSDISQFTDITTQKSHYQ